MMFIICIGYTGALMSLLTVPMQPKLLETLKDVSSNPIPVYQLDIMIPLIAYSVNQDVQDIVKNMKPHTDFEVKLKKIVSLVQHFILQLSLKCHYLRIQHNLKELVSLISRLKIMIIVKNEFYFWHSGYF